MDRAQTPLKEVHHTYQEDQSSSNQSEDHALPHDYSGPPEPQPGFYADGEPVTSKNTTYAELQDSLVTQGEELLMQGRFETALSLDVNAVGDNQKLPPPPPPKKGE